MTKKEQQEQIQRIRVLIQDLRDQRDQVSYQIHMIDDAIEKLRVVMPVDAK